MTPDQPPAPRQDEQAAGGVSEWGFGPVAAAQLIAATSWPFERTENRESWAPRLITEPDMLDREYAAAIDRLVSAYSYLRAALAASTDGSPP